MFDARNVDWPFSHDSTQTGSDSTMISRVQFHHHQDVVDEVSMVSENDADRDLT